VHKGSIFAENCRKAIEISMILYLQIPMDNNKNKYKNPYVDATETADPATIKNNAGS